MPRNWSKAVPEDNGSVPQPEFGPDQPTLAEIYRLFEKRLDRKLNRMKSHFNELTERISETNQHSVSLERDDARQPRLAMEADVKSDTKTRKRTKGATAADQAKYRDSCSTKRIQAGPTSSTSFSTKAESPALPRMDDVLVDKGAAAPKPCLSPVEMRTLTAAGGLLPAGKASTATKIIFYQPPFWFCPTKEINSRTTIQYAMNCSSF